MGVKGVGLGYIQLKAILEVDNSPCPFHVIFPYVLLNFLASTEQGEH